MSQLTCTFEPCQNTTDKSFCSDECRRAHKMQLHAAYMRNYRKEGKQAPRKPKFISAEVARKLSDDAVEQAIRARGRELTEMMRTPLCMWLKEWTEEDNEC